MGNELEVRKKGRQYERERGKLGMSWKERRVEGVKGKEGIGR